ncbi:DUF2190 family protein [Cypionkella sinensis]|uniref:DUF2190 family protein n=1 Tax=Cypionkella sinensis TaxID=1756043 RepID=A0ABV7J0L1_9RHOB
MKNYVQAGNTITVPAPYAVASGAGAKVGAIIGIAQHSAVITDPVLLSREGVFTVAKVSAQAWAVGDKIYWDDAAKNFTTTSSANTLVGTALAIAVNPTATGVVLLDGCVR